MYFSDFSRQTTRKIPAAEWDRYTTDIIAEANRVLVDGRPIRAFFDNCLSKMIEDLVAQSKAVDQAFQRRVEEYQEVIDKLDQQRIEVSVKIISRQVWTG